MLPRLWRFHQLERGARRGTCCAVSPPPVWPKGAGQVSAAWKMWFRWASEAPGSFRVNRAKAPLLWSSRQIEFRAGSCRVHCNYSTGGETRGSPRILKLVLLQTDEVLWGNVQEIWWLGMMGTTGSDVFTCTSSSTRSHRHLFTRFCLFVSYSRRVRFNVRLNLSVVFKTSRNACGPGISFLFTKSTCVKASDIGKLFRCWFIKARPMLFTWSLEPPGCSRNHIKIRLSCWCDCAQWKILSTHRGNKQLLSSVKKKKIYTLRLKRELY